MLYGVTIQGGASGAGTLFTVSASGTYRQLHDFAIADGVTPSGALVLSSSGTLYGVTSGGGSGHGTVFAITP